MHILHVYNLKKMSNRHYVFMYKEQLPLLTDKTVYALFLADESDNEPGETNRDLTQNAWLNGFTTSDLTKKEYLDLWSKACELHKRKKYNYCFELEKILNELQIQSYKYKLFERMEQTFLICFMEHDQYLKNFFLFHHVIDFVNINISNRQQFMELCCSQTMQDCFCHLRNISLDNAITATESMFRLCNCIKFSDLYICDAIVDCREHFKKWILPMFILCFLDDGSVFEPFNNACDRYFTSRQWVIDAVFQSLRRENSDKYEDFLQIIFTKIHKFSMEKQRKVVKGIFYCHEPNFLQCQSLTARKILPVLWNKEKHEDTADIRRRSYSLECFSNSYTIDKNRQRDSEKEIKLTIKCTCSSDKKVISENPSLTWSYEASKNVDSIIVVDNIDLSMFSKEKENGVSSMKDMGKHLDFLLGGRGLQSVVNIFVYPVVRSLEDTFSSLLSGVSRDEVMCNYLQRLASFSYVSDHSNIPSAIMMAKAGWYFTGILTETKCFSCLVSYSAWKHDDIPLQIHRDLSPACEFLQSIEDTESEQRPKQTNRSRTGLTGYGDIPNDKEKHFTPQFEHPEDVEKPHAFLEKENNSLCNGIFQSQTSTPFVAENGHLLNNCYQNCTSKEQTYFYEERNVDNIKNFSRPQNNSVLNEQQRETFVYSNESPTRTGLQYDVYRGSEQQSSMSQLRCDFRHLNVSSEASLSLDQGPHVSDRNTQFEKSLEKSPSYTKQLELPQKVFSNPNTNYQVQKQTLTQSTAGGTTAPKFPRYQSLPVRMSTFGTWPPTMQQKPRAMALAGFYYKGYGDAVVCFWCGITIVQWEDDDDPCIEHVKWQPTCFYMLSYKGEAFISLVKVQFPMPQSPEDRQRQIEANNVAEKEFPPCAEVFDITPYVNLLDMGFAEKNIEDTVRQLSLSTGNPKPHLDNVLENLLQSSETNMRLNTSNNDQQRSRWPTESAMSLMPDANPSGFAESSLRGIRAEETGKAQDNANTSQYANKNELMMCKICLDADVGVTFVPCGHLVACVRCSQSLHKCPICRQYIQQKIKCYVT